MSKDKSTEVLLSEDELRAKTLSDPVLQEKIAKAKARIAAGETGTDGMSPEELLKLASEQR